MSTHKQQWTAYDKQLLLLLGLGAVVIVLIALLLLRPADTACSTSTFSAGANNSQACLDERFDTCMATDKYTRQECIDLIGRK